MNPFIYAAAVRDRQKECQCATCKQIEMLPAVQRLLANWTKSPIQRWPQ